VGVRSLEPPSRQQVPVEGVVPVAAPGQRSLFSDRGAAVGSRRPDAHGSSLAICCAIIACFA
jgi:hypothetical protein